MVRTRRTDGGRSDWVAAAGEQVADFGEQSDIGRCGLFCGRAEMLLGGLIGLDHEEVDEAARMTNATKAAMNAPIGTPPR